MFCWGEMMLIWEGNKLEKVLLWCWTIWYLSANYSFHILDFNIPQIQYFPICQLNTPPPPNLYTFKACETSSKILKKLLLNHGLQTNRVMSRNLDYTKNNAFNQNAP